MSSAISRIYFIASKWLVPQQLGPGGYQNIWTTGIQLLLSFGTNLISSSKGISADFTSMASQKRAAQCGECEGLTHEIPTTLQTVELDMSHFW